MIVGASSRIRCGMPSWISTPVPGERAGLLGSRRQARLDEAERDGVHVHLERRPTRAPASWSARRDRPSRSSSSPGRGCPACPEIDVTLTTLRNTSRPCFAVAACRLAQVRSGCAQHLERYDGVDLEHGAELLVAHLVEHPVPRVAGVVDDDVELAERVERQPGRAPRRRRPSSGRRRRPPSRRRSRAAVCSARSASRSLTSTRAPCAASSSAVARPIPRAEPVTIATLPSSTPMACRRPFSGSLILTPGARREAHVRRT